MNRKNKHCACKTWRLDSSIDELVCSGLVSEDKKSSLWFAIATASLPTTTAGKIVVGGLLPDALYKVSLVSDNLKQLAVFSKKTPEWIDSGVTASGALLMTVGLTLPIMPAQSGLLIEVSAL